MAAEISFSGNLSEESWVSLSCGRLLSHQMAPLGLSSRCTGGGSYAEGQEPWTGEQGRGEAELAVEPVEVERR